MACGCFGYRKTGVFDRGNEPERDKVKEKQTEIRQIRSVCFNYINTDTQKDEHNVRENH